eukprot:5343827-Prymnesium_polylepis.2
MHSGRWVEAAHLFRPKLAPKLKMLSSGRRRAGRFDDGALSTQLERLLRPPRSEFLCGASFCAEAQSQGVHKTPRPVIAHTLLRLERAPAMDGCAGDPTLA